MAAIVEASIILRCVNRASREFEKISDDSKTLEDRLKGLSRGVAGMGALTMAAGRLAGAFGLVSPEAERIIHAIGSMEIAIGILMRTETFATIVTWAYNISLTYKIALLTLGVGVVIAFATAMWALSRATEAANKSMKEFSSYGGAGGVGGAGVSHTGYEGIRRGMEI